MSTMKEVIERTCAEDYEKDLFRAVVRQVGDWAAMWEHPEDYQDAGAGVSGFIYYTDTKPFAKRNLENIIKVLNDLEQDLSEPLKKDNDNLMNWYAWFALETVASWVMRAKEELSLA